MKPSQYFGLLLILIAFAMDGVGGGSAPFPADKLSVLVIESSEARDDIPRSQATAIQSTLWRTYVEKAGGQWKALDDQTDITKADPWVKSAMAVKRDSLPWLVISDGRTGVSKPLPQDLDTLLSELQKFGGHARATETSSSPRSTQSFNPTDLSDSRNLPLYFLLFGS